MVSQMIRAEPFALISYKKATRTPRQNNALPVNQNKYHTIRYQKITTKKAKPLFNRTFSAPCYRQSIQN